MTDFNEPNDFSLGNKYIHTMKKSKAPESVKRFLMIQSLKNMVQSYAWDFISTLEELQDVEPTNEIDSRIYGATDLSLGDAVSVLNSMRKELKTELYNFGVHIDYVPGNPQSSYGGVFLEATQYYGEEPRSSIQIYRSCTADVKRDLTNVLEETYLWDLSCAIFWAYCADTASYQAVELHSYIQSDTCHLDDIDDILELIKDWGLPMKRK